ncbi:MAG: epoxyqueuosine reductase QueH [Bacillota bacterium]
MRILMHSCCAPCTTFPLFLLRAEGYSVDGVFLNPNIHPDAERDKRWSVYRDFARSERFSVRRLDSSHEQWLSSVSLDLKKPGRCRLCYENRLFPVARLASEEGYDCFTTSLLLSIYQDHKGIVAAAEAASREAGVPFLYRDFRVGYRRSREMARGRHLYMQKYCGCEFSACGK